MQNKGKWLSSAQQGLRVWGALGGVQEMVAAQMALHNPDASHLTVSVIPDPHLETKWIKWSENKENFKLEKLVEREAHWEQ